MYTLKGIKCFYTLDEKANCISFQNLLTGHEYITMPGGTWKLIYSLSGTERVEAVAWSQEQNAPEAKISNKEITLTYSGLVGDDGRMIDATLTLRFVMEEDGLYTFAELENRDAQAVLQELQLTPLSGAYTLGGDPENDYLCWPRDLGIRVRDPAHNDLSTYAGFRKYERHDQYHTDMDSLYQGEQAAMQWYDWYNKEEGLCVMSLDTTKQALCLHAQRDTKLNVLRMGFIRYPMLHAGEKWKGEAIALLPHLGDWHAGSRMYRTWMIENGLFKAPNRPDWCQNMTGWLRVILKQHHCELNWDFSDIPALYDETEAAGFNVLYLLGWEKGGFARMWPDYEADERMGGIEKLKEGIEYVHRKGGKVLMFLSYALVDHQSEFYRHEGGDSVPIKSIWGEDVPFSETYCGEGTYRKIANPPMPMYLACPGAPLWQEKMKWAADQCLSLGADGVLYDIGAYTPYFCYAKNHTHAKPSHSHESKAENYRGLRENVKRWGDDKIIMMEHNVDVFGQHMDLAQGMNSQPDPRLKDPAQAADLNAARDDSRMLELYRYTFPELVMTNRECGEDEKDFLANAGYSFLLGLRFDMTIFRCCGSFKDIPAYAAYLKELNGLYHQYAEYILCGTFVDTDGFTCSDPSVLAKGWLSREGGLCATLWNPTADDRTVTLTNLKTGHAVKVTVPAQKTAAQVF